MRRKFEERKRKSAPSCPRQYPITYPKGGRKRGKEDFEERKRKREIDSIVTLVRRNHESTVDFHFGCILIERVERWGPKVRNATPATIQRIKDHTGPKV